MECLFLFIFTRSPFGLFYHAAWFTQPHHKEGFIAFIDTITKMPEVWLATNWQAIQWVRDPTPISRLNNFAPFQCNYPVSNIRAVQKNYCNNGSYTGARQEKYHNPNITLYQIELNHHFDHVTNFVCDNWTKINI